MIASDKYIRKDILFFNLIMVFILAVIAIVLLYAPTMGTFNLFIPFACLLFNMIVSHNLGLQRGLMAGIVLTFAFGSYIIYETMIINRITEVNFAYIAWLFFFPLSSILAGQLSLVVSNYRRELENKKSLEQLVTIDASTGLYNSQGFFRKLEEEFVRAKRYKTCFSILLIKMSNFDELQVIYGEIDSIKILQSVAGKVELQTRFSDIKALISADILGIMLPETNEDGARIVIEKLHQALDRLTTEIRGTKKVIRIKPSIGISSIKESDTDVLEAYQRAKEELNYDRG
ncbi:putative diguanylate cyclase AdrA [Methylomusa anaerophila]|uniref:Putative diguanylate cyclase AdrA n=2 Tax=Methylomusa anaerophila TaxID=1930071 RepID=A0A348AR25_9FIRM|nr:putative diguanylate cyclase AdrA [Methylomusa anaerophila]